MQPYQEASQEIRRQGELPLKTAQTLGSIGASAATAYLGGGVINSVLPFLSKYIPDDLAIKGLSKIDPRYGKFIDKALSAGKSIEEIKSFIGDKIQGKTEGEKPPEQRSIIEQYSPELFQFLKGEIEKGRAPLEAGAIAQSQESFKNIIKKMSEDHNAPFSSILESVFGGAQQPKKISSQTQQTSLQNQSQNRQINGDQALLSALDKMLKI